MKHRSNKAFALLALFVIASMALAACRPAATATPTAAPQPTSAPPTAKPAPTIHIGVTTPLTGGAAFLGTEQLNAVKIEAAMFEDETGLKVTVVEGDDQINPDEGKKVADQFTADADMYLVIGPAGSQVCEATQPIYLAAGLTHITSSCTRVSLTDPGTDTFFRPIPKDDDQAHTDAVFMAEQLGAKVVFLVDDQSSYGVGLTDGLEAELAGMNITVERASVTQLLEDFSSVVTSALAANADVVFIASQIANQITLLAVQLREQGFLGTYFTGDGGFDISWVEPAGAAGNGTYVSTFAPDPHDVSGMSDFVDAYTAEYGESFGPFAGAAALATRIGLEAIQRCVDADTLTRACVRDEVAATNMTAGMLGYPVSFGPGNQVQGAGFALYQVNDGKFTLVNAAEAPAVKVPSVPVKIGFVGPLTGGAGFLGTEQLQAVKIMVEMWNEKTGYNVEVAEQDDEINPDIGKNVAALVVADPDIYVNIGPAGSQVCEATQPIFADAGLAHITPSCTRVSLTDPGTDWFFRPIPKDDDQAATDATYIADTLGAKSVFLVDDQSSYGVGLTDGLEAELTAKGVTVERASVTQLLEDFSSVVTAVTAADADVVFIASQIANQITLLAVQLREQGYAGTYFTGDGGFDLSWVEPAGEAADGTYVSTFAPDPHDIPQMAEFVRRYTAEYSATFGPFAAASALATRIALEAIQRCVNADSLSRQCVRDELAKTDQKVSVLGFAVKFGPGNQLIGGHFSLYKVAGGKFTLVIP